MSCARTPETLAALEADRLDGAVAEHAAGCDACARALTAAQLTDRGFIGDAVSDDAPLAALGLGEMPAGVDASDRDFLAALAEAPDGALPAPPAFDLADIPQGAPLSDRPSALSRPMAMIPFDEMVDPTPAPIPLAPTAVPTRRSRWPAFVAVGGALAAALLAFVLWRPMWLGDEGLPAAGEVGENQPAATAPTKQAVGGPAEKAAAEARAAAEEAAAEKAAAEAEARAAEERAAAEAEDGDDGEEVADDGEQGDGDEVAAAKPKPSRRATRRTRRAPAPAAAPKPAARKPSPRKPARQKEESASEVDDLLGALDGSGGGSKSRAASPAASPTPSPVGDPMLPEKLTKRQILTVVKRNARTITTCKEGTDASGTVPVEMVIGRAGRVTSAKVKSGPQKGTPVGSCIERKVRAFRFPQFSGDPMRVVMPFAL